MKTAIWWIVAILSGLFAVGGLIGAYITFSGGTPSDTTSGASGLTEGFAALVWGVIAYFAYKQATKKPKNTPEKEQKD